MELRYAVLNRMDEMNYSDCELARKANINHSNLRKSLNGRKNMTGYELLKLMKALDWDANDAYESVFGSGDEPEMSREP